MIRPGQSGVILEVDHKWSQGEANRCRGVEISHGNAEGRGRNETSRRTVKNVELVEIKRERASGERGEW